MLVPSKELARHGGHRWDFKLNDPDYRVTAEKLDGKLVRLRGVLYKLDTNNPANLREATVLVVDGPRKVKVRVAVHKDGVLETKLPALLEREVVVTGKWTYWPDTGASIVYEGVVEGVNR